ncbi:hypothetical protein ABVK25_007364 [Lepraria finkii]|uniref:Uncharacterized protein n=1 Tax=Lepraria finkii TaxID=1340010 RepID=A0ABR4B3L6_9LECA
MDPLIDVGLAANSVQFISFGINAVSKGSQTYQSSNGEDAANPDLAIASNDLLILRAKTE